ncbi:glycoside hydrolase family 99-like domain-containing protein [Cyclobacterium plantarum]|uniref:glycoside hydrolase family 99-like domain-containing protein n=1 Tax=Cyclobacterium plantarum TaxID=2716263 RepID=UPI003F719BDA
MTINSIGFISLLVINGMISGCSAFVYKQDTKNSTVEPQNEPNSKNVAVKGNSGRENVPDIEVGVFFMPSWNVSGNDKQDIDSFWPCLQGRENCSFLTDKRSWGPNGRIYNASYPYEGPFLEKKPVKELKGFYKRDDPEVARKQLDYMHEYGIDFIAYNWFFGRHYYYHKNFAPQAQLYYPENWPIDTKRDGRVQVPGLEEWNDQLEVLLQENAKRPEGKQLKFALNWCDDSDDRWIQWLRMASPQNINSRTNYPGETPDKQLYLKVHDKITLLWIDKYFQRKDYLKDDSGRPVVYMYFPHDTEARASYYGIGLNDLLQRSQDLAREAGLPGIKFIAVTSGAMTASLKPYALPTTWKPLDAKQPWQGGKYTNRMLFQDYVPRLKSLGFEGMTAYIYHDFYEQNNKSYSDMRKTYQGHWDKWSAFFKKDADFDYQIPVAMGWDRRPAGGTWPQQSGFPSEPLKDKVVSDKSSFKAKITAAKEVLVENQPSNGNTLMVCCWNEYLEGNHIEPTEGHGFDYLEVIRALFKTD